MAKEECAQLHVKWHEESYAPQHGKWQKEKALSNIKANGISIEAALVTIDTRKKVNIDK